MPPYDSPEVCFLINNLDTGGAQTLLRNIVELDDRSTGNYTLCYAGGTNELGAEFEALDVEVVDLGARTERPQFDPRPPVRTLQFFGDREFDVIHGHLPYGAVLARLAGQRANAAVVTTHHSVRKNYHPIERSLERATRRYDDATVFVSNGVAASFDDRGVDAPALTIYNGIDAAAFGERIRAADGGGLREDLGATGDTLVLTVGRCIGVKRQVDLVRAVDRLTDRADEPAVHVAIVGDGPERSALETAVDDRGLGEYVSVVGRVPYGEIHRYYAAADLYAQVSLYEGMPMTLLEAMAAGLPIIGTTVPGIEEFVDADVGRLVPPQSPQALAEAMSTLTDDGLRRRLGQTCTRRVTERYGIDRTVAAYHDLYEQVTAESVGSTRLTARSR